MAYFPMYTTIGFANPLRINMQYKTLKSAFDDLGEEKRKRKWLYPRRNIELSYQYISKADARTIWQFYQARYGSYEAFSFFVGYSDTYVDEYVGTGDGSTTIFNCPSRNAASYTVYVDGDPMEEDVEYTMSGTGGTDGADKITFTVAPADGSRILMDFSGELKVYCRFKDDNLSFDNFYDQLVTMGITLQGLLNE